MIRRKKVTIFTDAKESTTVLEVKKIVEGIVKQKTEDQRLFKDDQVYKFVMLQYCMTLLYMFLCILIYS